MTLIRRLLRFALWFTLAGMLLAVIGVAVAWWLLTPTLPSVDVLKDVRMHVPMRVYTADQRLVATFGEMRRIPVDIDDVPEQLINAFLAAEDAKFYDHPGIDWQGFSRAVGLMIVNRSLRVPGGSTITQQVARNFFLSPQVSITRKVSEIFLSLRIERELSKDEILELYLNKIFLGHRAYGVAAAAALYYGKTLDELTLAESAMLASLPKFPSTGNPLYNRPRAIERRNYVLGRMRINGFIDQSQYEQGLAEEDLSYEHEPAIEVDAPYAAELVRLEATQLLGNEALTGGYVVHTTLDGDIQLAAHRALRKALLDYDLRHGYRGAEAKVELAATDTPETWATHLRGYGTVAGLVPALVVDSSAELAQVYLSDGQVASLDLDAVRWARPQLDENRRGAAPKTVAEVLAVGDIVRVGRDDDGNWVLGQLPSVQGALVSLDPEDGAIRAMSGGFSFSHSKFNRATQSARQPGSSFKPFLYAAALDRGFTPATVINDAPIALPDVSRPDGIWAPKNDNNRFSGPTRMREALIKSINLVSVRLLDAVGVNYAREYTGRFGLSPEQVPANLSMALGTAAVSPLAMARGQAVFANGGYLVEPYLITQIDDRDMQPVYRANPRRACRQCPQRHEQDLAQGRAGTPALTNQEALAAITEAYGAQPENHEPPPLEGVALAHDAAHDEVAQVLLAPRTIDARTAWLVTSMMRDVVQRGTGSAARVLERGDLAGKTGSTNEHRDAWFAGFSPTLATVAWVGFDDFSSLGRGEFGAKAALPMWIDLMRTGLDGTPEQSFDMPPGLTTARIDPDTGFLVSSADAGGLVEYFKIEDMAAMRARTRQDQDEEREQRQAYDVF